MAGRGAHAGQGGVFAVVLGVQRVAVCGNVGSPVTADLVNPGVENLLEALRLGEVCHRAKAAVAKVGRAKNLPVGGDHAVPASGLSQDVEGLLVVGATDDLSVLLVVAVGDAVVGHDRSHLAGLAVEVHATVDERDEVGIVVVAGEDVVLAGVVVVVAAALGCTGTAVVLEHAGDGVGAPAQVVAVVIGGRLHGANEGLGHVAVHRGILAHGAAETGPHHVRADVHLGAKVDASTGRTPSPAGVHAGLLPELRVHRGGEAVVVGDVIELVGVGRVHVRDAPVTVLLAVLLDGVDPLDVRSEGVEVRVCARDACAHALVELLGGVVVKRSGGAHHAIVEHEGQDLLGGELICQRGRAICSTLAPVLVEVELAVAVEVLEGQAVHLDDLGSVHNAQLGAAVRVGVAGPAVAGLLARPLCLDVGAVRVDGVLVGAGRGRSGTRARVAAGRAGRAARQPRERGGSRGSREEVPSRYASLLHGSLLFGLPFLAPHGVISESIKRVEGGRFAPAVTGCDAGAVDCAGRAAYRHASGGTSRRGRGVVAAEKNAPPARNGRRSRCFVRNSV